MPTPFSFPLPSSFGSGFSFLPNVGGSSLSSLNPTATGGRGGVLDQLIDPVTLDYVRDGRGNWAETADSRTAMLIQLETRLGRSPFFPDAGSAIKDMLEDGTLDIPELAQQETIRAAQVLEDAGLIAHIEVAVRDDQGVSLRDNSGRQVVHMSWSDLLAGSPIDLRYQPR